jgi:hypothetical protein
MHDEMENQTALLDTIGLQRAAFEGLGTPFYAALADELAADVADDGPIAHVLAPYAGAPFEAAYVLRLLGGVHRMVLSGGAPELATHYPSTGGDGDARAAGGALRELLTTPHPEISDALTRPPQTNEVGRSVALASGLLVIAHELRLPLRIRELGSSGGLNLRPDAYWYEQDGQGWGDADSPVRFVDLWDDGGVPPFVPGAVIVDRRGCDRDPVDVATPDGALTLLSYVWPEPAARFTRIRDAIAIANNAPVPIDRADVADWLPAQLREPVPGTVLVVFHSVMWQYLEADTRAALLAALAEAGAAATAHTPLAWLRLEPNPESYAPAELRLTIWDGSREAPTEHFLATTSFHGGPISWRG